MSDEKPLSLSEKFAWQCHARWIENRNNLQAGTEDEERPDEWYNDQCGQCRYYILLRGVGAFGSDWGVCSNAASPFDGRVMFEHDGCEQYSGADAWVSEYFEKSVVKPDNSL